MASLVLKDVPEDLHRRLSTRARRHQRSVDDEARAILEHALLDVPPVKLPKPVKTRKRVTASMVLAGIREGRE